jgi:hypothetical protein
MSFTPLSKVVCCNAACAGATKHRLNILITNIFLKDTDINNLPYGQLLIYKPYTVVASSLKATMKIQ